MNETAKGAPQGSLPRYRLRSALNWLLQAALAVVGLISLVESQLWYMFLWCVGGTLYAAVAVLLLGRASKRPRATTPGWPLKSTLLPLVWVFTVVPALIGVLSAFQVIVAKSLPELVNSELGEGLAPVVQWLGVWAMLLGWGFLHWGFAHIYAILDAAAAPGRVIQFPDADHQPGMVDYVYVAFTVGTTFAASDVSFLNSRIRWIVTLHSVLSFTLNALTIALAFNTIMGA